MTEDSASQPLKRKRGGQPGNQNARTHGFYSRALTPAQQEEFKDAVGLSGVDQEIAMLRVQLFAIIANTPDNTDVLLKAVTALTRLLKVKYQYEREDPQGISEAVHNVFRSIAVPAGLGPGFAQHFLAENEDDRQQESGCQEDAHGEISPSSVASEQWE